MEEEIRVITPKRSYYGRLQASLPKHIKTTIPIALQLFQIRKKGRVTLPPIEQGYLMPDRQRRFDKRSTQKTGSTHDVLSGIERVVDIADGKIFRHDLHQPLGALVGNRVGIVIRFHLDNGL